MLSPFSSVSAGGTTENVLTSLTPPLTRAKTTARNDPDRNDGLAGARASLIPAPAPPGLTPVDIGCGAERNEGPPWVRVEWGSGSVAWSGLRQPSAASGLVPGGRT